MTDPGRGCEPGTSAFMANKDRSRNMLGELFKSSTSTDLLHVPYKGSGPALNDTLGGQVNVFFDNLPSSLPHIQSGKLQALAVSSPAWRGESPGGSPAGFSRAPSVRASRARAAGRGRAPRARRASLRRRSHPGGRARS